MEFQNVCPHNYGHFNFCNHNLRSQTILLMQLMKYIFYVPEIYLPSLYMHENSINDPRTMVIRTKRKQFVLEVFHHERYSKICNNTTKGSN